MLLTTLWTTFAIISTIFAMSFHTGAAVTSAILQGAQTGITLSISIAGGLCLWSGVGALMEKLALTDQLASLLRPILFRLFPSAKNNRKLSASLSANICANLLGLGNAATPMGIQAVRQLQDPKRPDYATDEMCRLVVMNTASIQLLPTTVAAVRTAAGSASPFDILPCVWLSSILSVSAGLSAAYIFARVKHDF